MAEEEKDAAGKENFNPAVEQKAGLDVEEQQTPGEIRDTSQVTLESQSIEEGVDEEGKIGCDTPCRCHQQKALALQRAVNARRQVEGLREQLSHAQTHAEEVGTAWKRRVEEMEAEYNEQVKDLTAEADRLRARLADVDGGRRAREARCKQLEERNKELEDKLAAVQQRAQEQLDEVLQKRKSQRSSLYLQLGQERSLSMSLKTEVNRLREQVQVLEEHLQMALIELRRREEVLEAFGIEALERLAAGVGVEGRADLLRLITVLKGSSWPANGFGSASASTKCDSGYHGSSVAEGRDKSGCPLVKTNLPEKDLVADADEIAEAKRKLRRSNEKVERLLKLRLHREQQASLLEDRLSSPETTGCKMRTASSGFVPTRTEMAHSPLPCPTRKVSRKKKKQLLSSTPHGELLETLADVSSICHDATDNSASLDGQPDEARESSGSVFLWESNGGRTVSNGCPDCKDQENVPSNRHLNENAPSIGDEPALSCLQQDSLNDKKSSSKTSRGSSRVVTKDVPGNSIGNRKTKACRSLDFSRPDATMPTVPFTFSTGGSNTPASGLSDISFTASGPVVLNFNLVPR